jgi:DNA adenine methylase
MKRKILLCDECDESFPKPILKWVGGKTQILDTIINEFPENINNYHEVFLGGGSVLLALLTNVKKGIIHIKEKIYAYDLNEALIYVYKNIQLNHNELYDKTKEFVNEYNECTTTSIQVNRNPSTIQEAKQCKENYYYWIRKQYNQLYNEEKRDVLGSAMFIFLNKTCFRGIFRVGPHGFNVPYGNYKNPEIINKEHISRIHELIQEVIFECCDFTKALSNIKENDYVYLDPPYAPESDTSFVGYTEQGFNIEKHIQLFEICDNLTSENKKIMMSNSNVSIVRNHFQKETKYKIKNIECKRSINSKNPKAKTIEVIIQNY